MTACVPKIYIAHHKPLKPMWETFLQPIRVGQYQDVPKGVLTDNTGVNIAAKNKEYAELTALYWIWKNDTTSTHIGLWHYGRWMLPDANDHAGHLRDDHIIYYNYMDWLKRGLNNPMLRADMIVEACRTSDIIVPYWKTLAEGSIEKQFVTSVPQPVLEMVYQAFDRLYPHYPSLRAFMQTEPESITCNMAIMRRDLFDAYCQFLFSILAETEKDPYVHIHVNGLNPDAAALTHGRDPRWAGFWGERLLDYYTKNIWLKDASITVKNWHMLCFW